MNTIIRVLVCLLAITGCVSPLEYDIEPQDILVVEGFIDDDYGPHEIQISYTSTFGSVLEGGQTRRLDARVTIYDDLGNVTNLERTFGARDDLWNSCPPGCCPTLGEIDFATNYFTPEHFKGIPGRSYSLEVTLKDIGKTYRSTPQRMPGPIVLDSIFFEYKTIASDNELQNQTGVDVFAMWKDDASSENYYLWDLNGTYKIETPSISGLCCMYDPRDELGDKCWVVEKNVNNEINTSADRLYNGERRIENIGFILDDTKRFSSIEVVANKQYHVEASQYSITKEAYDFYFAVDILSEVNGEIFDPPPVNAVGNVFNTSDPNETVVGYFGVFAKTTKEAFIDRGLLGERKEHNTCGDCRHFFGGQLETPEVFKEL